MAQARLAIGDPAGAEATARRAVALFDAENPALIENAERPFRARALLVIAIVDGRNGRRADGCLRLARAEADIAAYSPADGGPGRLLTQAHETLGGCAAR